MLVYLNEFFSEKEIKIILTELMLQDSWAKRSNVNEEYSQLYLSNETAEDFMRRTMLSILDDKLHKLHALVSSLYPYKMDMFKLSYLNFYKYETQSSIGKHKDVRNIYGYSDFVSTIFYLNDDYYGGIFKAYNNNKCILKVAPKAGDVIMLTKDIEHESTRLKSGNKYIAIHHWGYN